MMDVWHRSHTPLSYIISCNLTSIIKYPFLIRYQSPICLIKPMIISLWRRSELSCDSTNSILAENSLWQHKATNLWNKIRDVFAVKIFIDINVGGEWKWWVLWSSWYYLACVILRVRGQSWCVVEASLTVRRSYLLHSTVSLLTQGDQQTMSSNKLKTFLNSIVQSFIIHSLNFNLNLNYERYSFCSVFFRTACSWLEMIIRIYLICSG